MIVRHFAVIFLILICLSATINGQTNGGRVVNFNLILGGTRTIVANLREGAVIRIPNGTQPSFGIVAVTVGSPITEVIFSYNEIGVFSTESYAPYSMCGNVADVIHTCAVLGVGSHIVNATIQDSRQTYSVKFQIVYNNEPFLAPAVMIVPKQIIVPVPATPPKQVPVALPINVPIAQPKKVPAPVRVPVPLPKIVPVASPKKVPVRVPVNPPKIVPIAPPNKVPVRGPVTTPIIVPIAPPKKVPVRVPVTTPIIVPVPRPIAPPIKVPMSVPIPVSSPTITFTLIYTGNNTDIVQLRGGMVINVTAFPSSNFNIRADTTNTQISSLLFLPSNQAETSKPWAYCGNAGDLFNTCGDFNERGSFTITARPYSGPYQSGTVFPDVSITFTLVGTPTPTELSTFPILINCGGPTITDTQSRIWMTDTYFTGGNTYSNSGVEILSTTDDILYQSERNGKFKYEIPIVVGSYSVVFHFAEIYWTKSKQRIFDILVEGTLIADIDICERTIVPNTMLTIDFPVLVSDGFLTIEAMDNDPRIDSPKLSAIEVRFIGKHYSHAVTGGPYSVVDSDGDGVAAVPVDGKESHTHGPGESLVSFVWKQGSSVIGNGENTTLSLPIGEHRISLSVTDSSGDENTDTTTVVVLPETFPEIVSISPTKGSVAGGITVTITGSGFTSVTSVQFGLKRLGRQEITVVSPNIITLKSPISARSLPAPISVTTSVGVSNVKLFQYLSSIPVQFTSTKLISFEEPTAIAFGPDSKLYVGSYNGKLAKYTLNDRFDTVISSVITTVERYRGILGIAFDPLDDADTNNPTVYVTTSRIYHDEAQNSFGDAINGKVLAVSGANLDVVTAIVTGLPVSSADHSVNCVHFGNDGELYITVGSNTNGGIPGELSRDKLMSENYFSGAVLVAHIGKPNFNGFLTYDTRNNGNPVNGFGPNGVEVYASGLRNSFGIVMHSNGKLYATENGPNTGFGDMATGCKPGQFIPDAYGDDELNIIVRGGYYGHPNHKRAESDPRQCFWRASNDPNTTMYIPPLMTLQSSTNSVIEYDANYFNGEMRHNLVVSKYEDELYRIILARDGNSVIPSSIPAIEIGGNSGLAVAQAPNGNLIDVRFETSDSFVYKPDEPFTTQLMIYSVFPRRGGLVGGSTISIYGVNFNGSTVKVLIGTSSCSNPMVSANNTIIRCTLPPSATVGLKNVVVETSLGVRKTLRLAYKYIKGAP